MFDFDTLSRRPAAFRSPTGMDPAEFTALADRFAEAARAASATTARAGTPQRRRRAQAPAALDARGR